MTETRSLAISASIIIFILVSIASFNFYVDPLCYFHCNEIKINRQTVNLYYEMGQRILAHSDAKIVVLGSSRGQSVPPKWIEKVSGLKTLNLSMGGVELWTKIAFLKLSQEKTKIKKVIWLADYFEIINEIADTKIKSTPALRAYLPSEYAATNLITKLPELIDHNTLEASFYLLGHPQNDKFDEGSGSQINYEKCQEATYQGEKTIKELRQDMGIIYESYTQKVLKPLQSEKEWNVFENQMKILSDQAVDVSIVITPYHPLFIQKLQAQFPEIYERHQKWINRITSLNLPHIKALNYFGGLQGDDGSPAYWNDGVHFTCKSAIQMLKPLL